MCDGNMVEEAGGMFSACAGRRRVPAALTSWSRVHASMRPLSPHGARIGTPGQAPAFAGARATLASIHGLV